MFSKQVKEEIALAVIKVLLSRFNSFPEDGLDNRNAPFHEAFLNAFSDKLDGKIPNIPYFISLSSWLHGLSTSLGQSFFESVAHTLCEGEKKSFTKKQKTLLGVRAKQKEIISNIMTDLKNGEEKPNLHREDKLLRDSISEGNIVDANGFTADVFFETDTDIFIIELKTVKPNAGIMRDEKRKILEAKAALLPEYPTQKINYFIGFPFDPNSSTATGYDKKNFLETIIDGEKYFEQSEVLLASELWEFLSGNQNAMQEILDIINIIARPDFMENYVFLKNPKNRTKEPTRYKTLIEKWFLYSELHLLNNAHLLLRNRTYKQSMFSSEGKYKWNRYSKLLKLLAEEN